MTSAPRSPSRLRARAHSASAGERAYAGLRDAIREGRLKPGARLTEIELAGWLGASRTPVREALGRLEAEGLVMRDRRRGTIVTDLDASMVAELYAMREVLEGAAAAFAAQHASDAEIAALRALVSADRAGGGDAQAFARRNRQFHEALYRAAHNRYLVKTLSALRESMALLGPTTLGVHGRSATALGEHEALVRTLERRDAAKAEAAARAHIRAAYRARLIVMLDAS
jgi:DNA-binding GntR family transcriptional regulator